MDIQAKVTHISYIYDYYHDDEPLVYRGIHPEKSVTKCPIDLKFIVNSYNSENKDEVGFHIQFKPRWTWKNESRLSYFKDYETKYGIEFPIGMFLDIWDDEIKQYRKWLITENANTLGNQFPTWYILPIDHVFQWIHQGVKHQMCGVLRSQSSYNSGIWTDYKISSPEDQQKFALPLNNVTEFMYYNQRMIIDAPVSTEPRVWQISKINRLAALGICVFTCAQDKFDQHHDYIERDDDGNVIGMWADYYTESVEPEPMWKPIISSHIHSKITYNGAKPEIKVGGTPKKLTITFYDDNEVITHLMGDWSFYVDDTDISNFVQWNAISDNQISVDIKDIDAEYIGKVVRITNTTTDNVVSYVDMEIAYL